MFWNSIQDIKHRTLHNGGLIVGAGVVLLLIFTDGLCSGVVKEFLLSEEIIPWKHLWGMVPGIAVVIMSQLTKGCIGKGDGYLLCICGAALGIRQSVSFFFYGLMLAGGISAVLLALKKVKRNTKLPFVPFLFAGFLLTLLQQRI